MPLPVIYEQTTESRLLTSIAAEYNTANKAALTLDGLRWWAVGIPPRAIAVVTRGKEKKHVKTISKQQTPELWLEWQPVLAELQTERASKKRVNHDNMKAKGTL